MRPDADRAGRTTIDRESCDIRASGPSMRSMCTLQTRQCRVASCGLATTSCTHCAASGRGARIASALDQLRAVSYSCSSFRESRMVCRAKCGHVHPSSGDMESAAITRSADPSHAAWLAGRCYVQTQSNGYTLTDNSGAAAMRIPGCRGSFRRAPDAAEPLGHAGRPLALGRSEAALHGDGYFQ